MITAMVLIWTCVYLLFLSVYHNREKRRLQRVARGFLIFAMIKEFQSLCYKDSKDTEIGEMIDDYLVERDIEYMCAHDHDIKFYLDEIDLCMKELMKERTSEAIAEIHNLINKYAGFKGLKETGDKN